MIATPWPTIALVAMYLFIVKVGPKIMENRKAYSLREVLIVYNFALVLLSAWMVYEVIAEYAVLLRKFSLFRKNFVLFDCFHVFLVQFIASVLDIPNFNLLCERVPYVRDDPRQIRVGNHLKNDFHPSSYVIGRLTVKRSGVFRETRQ